MKALEVPQNFHHTSLESVPLPWSCQPAVRYHCLSLLPYRDLHGTVAWALVSLCRFTILAACLPLSGTFGLPLLSPLLKTRIIPSSWHFLPLSLHSGDLSFHFVDIPFHQEPPVRRVKLGFNSIGFFFSYPGFITGYYARIILSAVIYVKCLWLLQFSVFLKKQEKKPQPD